MRLRFQDMRDAGIAPSVRSFNSLLEAAKRSGHPDTAYHVLHQCAAAASSIISNWWYL